MKVVTNISLRQLLKPLECSAIAAFLLCAGNTEAEPYAGWAVGNVWNGYGTILRSTDSGNTWVRQGAGQIAAVDMAGVIAVDPLTAWVVGNSDGYATIYRTTDGGITWSREGTPAGLSDANLAKVAAFGDNRVWAVGTQNGTQNGVILHTSDGITWTNLTPSGYEGVQFQGVCTPDGTNVWVSGGSKDGYAVILKSSDGGLTWTRQSGGDVTGMNHILGVSAIDENTIWAMGGYDVGGNYGCRVLVSTNGGANWVVKYQGQHDGNEVYAVDHQTVWAVSDAAVVRTTDGGATWDVFTTYEYTMGICAVSSQQAWAVRYGLGGTIYHTANGGSTWTELNNLEGQSLPSLWTISFSPQPIPEPSTLALVALGCFGLLLRRRLLRE